MRIVETETIEYGWSKDRTLDNDMIGNMSDSQHRAITMLAYYKHMFKRNLDCFHNDNYKAVDIYTRFFLKSLPIILRTSGLPELNLAEKFETQDGEVINREVDTYLRYIDRKHGTWYAPLAA